MSPLERSIDRELRRNRLPVHVRRRQARRLTAAVEAAGYAVPGPLVPGDPVLNQAALSGAQVAIGFVQAARQLSAGVEEIVRRLQGRL
ncbi:hypothetical protein SAMN05216360_103111 [Methylobacterium phyllostachyos]|uniref:Uncharacterized protein n=1 Tax=Methylobacterium phyllostachyos TaxID=582672 RepID=A0A1G9V9Z2_9HYPH|nr:hypothetical protein [Methylobacterium phyllostachyos]SDM68695.1 hypothetical protein SAMN05216360_103111 [Methylobacterium phyllostachyos]